MKTSPSEQAKALGLPSLAFVTRTTGTSKQTLINWYNDKPELFEIVLLGCLSFYQSCEKLK